MIVMRLLELFSKRKGASLQQLPAAALIIVVASITIGIGAWLLGEIRDAATFTEVNTTLNAGIDAMGNLGTWLPIIAIVVAAAIIIGLIVAGFGRGRGF